MLSTSQRRGYPNHPQRPDEQESSAEREGGPAINRELTWRQAVRGVAGLLLALTVLLMHTQVTNAATAGAMATMPGAVETSLGTGLPLMGDQVSAATSLTGPGDPAPGSGGCAGHASICKAILTEGSVAVPPAPTCHLTTRTEADRRPASAIPDLPDRAPDPPTPEQALLQVWRC